MKQSWEKELDEEVWKELLAYPGYEVSNTGFIKNTSTLRVKQPSTNQQGILMVNFSYGSVQRVRSVSRIVIENFKPDHQKHFDTPIHLDGNRSNCHINNLEWRPRWFASKYHTQFNKHERVYNYGFRTPVEIIETGEQFKNSWDAAVKYGLLDNEIFVAVQNNTYVFPLGKRFRVLDQ